MLEHKMAVWRGVQDKVYPLRIFAIKSLYKNRLRHYYIGSKMYSRAGQCKGRCAYGSVWVVSMCRCGPELV